MGGSYSDSTNIFEIGVYCDEIEACVFCLGGTDDNGMVNRLVTQPLRNRVEVIDFDGLVLDGKLVFCLGDYFVVQNYFSWFTTHNMAQCLRRREVFNLKLLVDNLHIECGLNIYFVLLTVVLPTLYPDRVVSDLVFIERVDHDSPIKHHIYECRRVFCECEKLHTRCVLGADWGFKHTCNFSGLGSSELHLNVRQSY